MPDRKFCLVFKRFFAGGCLRKNFVLDKPEVSSRQKSKIQLNEDDSNTTKEENTGLKLGKDFF